MLINTANISKIQSNTYSIYLSIEILFLQICCELDLVTFIIKEHLLPVFFTTGLIFQCYGGCMLAQLLRKSYLSPSPGWPAHDSPCQPHKQKQSPFFLLCHLELLCQETKHGDMGYYASIQVISFTQMNDRSSSTIGLHLAVLSKQAHNSQSMSKVSPFLCKPNNHSFKQPQPSTKIILFSKHRPLHLMKILVKWPKLITDQVPNPMVQFKRGLPDDLIHKNTRFTIYIIVVTLRADQVRCAGANLDSKKSSSG